MPNQETALLPGHATPEGTKAYQARFGARLPESHYSDFLKTHIKMSSIGIGTFPGQPDEATDEAYARIVSRALQEGVNVIDTGANYRYGRSPRAVGEGVRRALAAGVPREAMFLVSKGGFLTLPEGRPDDMAAFFRREIMAKGLGSPEDLAQGIHLLNPAYILWQLEQSRRAMGVETLDAFLVDQPEIHIPLIGKERMHRKLLRVFEALEMAVAAGKLRYYGISTFNACRVETDNPLFQSMTSLIGLAEKAAGEGKRHHLRIVQMPFNYLMTEGFTRFSQATGQGNVASTIQAAFQLRLYLMASHTLGKGILARESPEIFPAMMPTLANPAQRAIQFNRSTPGVGTTLVGISQPAHLEDALAVARSEPLPKEQYLKMYQRAED
ncbi:MAG: aldo/keto reductase [Pseudomonadota bacterium]|uniref:aldo/keto reductase n=1 Tax=Thermithiobacillus tepidarius TaxID=929 RepID=UPI00041C3FEF|nr:aldo/keto reductase [Thermithiobacillus tepidarius]